MKFFSLFFIFIIGILFLSLFLYCLIDILNNKFKDNEKVVWVVLVVLLPFIGSVLYLLIGRNHKLNKIE